MSKKIKTVALIAWMAAVIALLAAILACTPRAHECATCSARTYDTYQITDNNGRLVDVCAVCYLLADGD